MTGVDLPESPSPEPDSREITYREFGDNFIRRILHERRVMESIDRVLGDGIELGPIGAGPGRVFAKITAVGTFRPCRGEAIEGELLAYRVTLPVSVDFTLDISVGVHRFHAEVLLPLTLTVRTEEPLMIIWDITPPDPEEVTILVETDKRSSAVLQRMSGLDEELRRFLVRVVAKELEKPHVRKATRIDMFELIDGAWDAIADQFLPPVAGPAAEPATVSADEPGDRESEAVELSQPAG